MLKKLRRASALILAAALTLAPAGRVFAQDDVQETAEDAEDQTLEARMEVFRSEHGLNEDNFSISYYNPATGERYTYGADRLMPAASTYKLPLNMYYYDLERAGEVASDEWIGGYTLGVCHEQSIVYSNNEISEKMIYDYPGTFYAYKNAMLELFGMEETEVPPEFYYGNYYSTGMMMAALERLYENAEDYDELIGYMKEAFPQDGYFRKYVTEYEIAHKYGSFEGAENDVGIIYADQPFLLAVYTHYPAYTPGEEVCAQAARLLTDYTNTQYAQLLAEQAAQEEAERRESERIAAEAEQQEQLERQRAEAEQRELAEQAAQEEAERQEEERLEQERAAAAAAAQTEAEKEESLRVKWTDYLWMLAVAGGIFLIAGVILYSALHKVGKYEARMKKKYGKFTKNEKGRD